MEKLYLSAKSKYLYWIITIVVAIIYLITGIGNLVPFEHIAGDMTKLGYPFYLMKFLGVCKILGALVLILPVSNTLKICAYTGMAIDLAGAAYSRLAVHDEVIKMMIPIIVLGLVFSSWRLKPL